MNKGASRKRDRAVVNGAGQAVSALRASVPSAWHYANKPVTLNRRAYHQSLPRTYGKPDGLWISIEGENDWPSWCEAEDYYPDRLTHRHKVSFTDDANILWIESELDLDLFDERFGSDSRFGGRDAIDWRDLAARYDGVVIAPYQWSRRLKLNWYYVWDCASGCIWNLDAIEFGPAQAIETRQGRNAETGSVRQHESAVPQGCAPTDPDTPSNL